MWETLQTKIFQVPYETRNKEFLVNLGGCICRCTGITSEPLNWYLFWYILLLKLVPCLVYTVCLNWYPVLYIYSCLADHFSLGQKAHPAQTCL